VPIANCQVKEGEKLDRKLEGKIGNRQSAVANLENASIQPNPSACS
jgi:hypothetical protein